VKGALFHEDQDDIKIFSLCLLSLVLVGYHIAFTSKSVLVYIPPVQRFLVHNCTQETMRELRIANVLSKKYSHQNMAVTSHINQCLNTACHDMKSMVSIALVPL
jgi:hypothetical protein